MPDGLDPVPTSAPASSELNEDAGLAKEPSVAVSPNNSFEGDRFKIMGRQMPDGVCAITKEDILRLLESSDNPDGPPIERIAVIPLPPKRKDMLMPSMSGNDVCMRYAIVYRAPRISRSIPVVDESGIEFMTFSTADLPYSERRKFSTPL